MIVSKEDVAEQTIYMFIDDSGVFHVNSRDRFFVYAGYVFIDNLSKMAARSSYTQLVRAIKRENEIKGELKAFDLAPKHKRALFNVVKNYDSFSVAIELSKVKSFIMNDKLSIHRYKDYALKRMIKKKMQALIKDGKVDPNKDVSLVICIDEQHTSTDGYYTLKESIASELKHGVSNFDYGVFHAPILNAGLKVSINFCDSNSNYLVQASDILANRLYAHYNFGYYKLADIPNHHTLDLP